MTSNSPEQSLFPGISSKATTGAALRQQFGKAPRRSGELVVLCHGTFDIVHPGHLRQFAYAKQLGAHLVVSVTSDRWVSKDGVRPYLPEEIRALNLSALEIVDAVVVDDHENPLELISTLQPDIFIKGFDYEDLSNPKTREEKELVESYGGVLRTSPGDFVLSSSDIISSRRVSNGREKALFLLAAEGLEWDEIEATLGAFKGSRVLIVGDTIVDRVSEGYVAGTSTKTPTISARETDENDFPGGAAIVALHMAEAGAQVTLVSLLGEDGEGAWVQSLLEDSGISVVALREKGRPTSLKRSFSIGGQVMLKWGRVDSSPIQEKTVQLINEQISASDCEMVVFSDFRHGIFAGKRAQGFLSHVPEGVVTCADSQVASRWGNILDFAGADILTPNELEARFALGDQDTPIRPLGEDLLRKSRGTALLLLKAGESGLVCYRRPLQGSDPRHFFAIDAMAESVVDAVGSGDALLAYSSLAWLSSRNPLISGLLGNAAAAIQCERLGNSPIAPGEVAGRLRRYLYE